MRKLVIPAAVLIIVAACSGGSSSSPTASPSLTATRAPNASTATVPATATPAPSVALEGEHWFRALVKYVQDDRPMDGSLLLFAEVQEYVEGTGFPAGTDVVVDAGGGFTIEQCRVPPPSAVPGDAVEVRAVLTDRRVAPVPEEYGDDLFEGRVLSICESERLFVRQASS